MRVARSDAAAQRRPQRRLRLLGPERRRRDAQLPARQPLRRGWHDEVARLPERKVAQRRPSMCRFVQRSTARGPRRFYGRATSLAICLYRPSDRTMASGVVVVVVVIVGVCNRSQMRTSKCTCVSSGVSIGLDPG